MSAAYSERSLKSKRRKMIIDQMKLKMHSINEITNKDRSCEERIWTPPGIATFFLLDSKEFSKFTYIRSLRWGATPDLNGVIHRFQAPKRSGGILYRRASQVLPGVPVFCTSPSNVWLLILGLQARCCCYQYPSTTVRQVPGIDRHCSR